MDCKATATDEAARVCDESPSASVAQGQLASVRPAESPAPARQTPPSLARLEERTLVLLPASGLAETLVQRIRPLTHGIRGPFWCLHVTVPGEDLEAHEELALRAAFYQARSLGGDVIEVEGESVEDAALRIAAEKKVTHILVGMTKRQRLWPFKGETLSEKLAKTSDATVIVVAEPQVG